MSENRFALAVLAVAAVVIATMSRADDVALGLQVPADVVSVYDGDTMTVDAHPWPGLTIRTAVRLLGLDTPEIRGQCPEEIALAERARDRLAALAGDLDVSDRTIRRWLAGSRAIPESLPGELARIIAARTARLQQLAAELRRAA